MNSSARPSSVLPLGPLRHYDGSKLTGIPEEFKTEILSGSQEGLYNFFKGWATANSQWLITRPEGKTRDFMKEFIILLNHCPAVDAKDKANLLLHFQENQPEFYAKYIKPLLEIPKNKLNDEVASILEKAKEVSKGRDGELKQEVQQCIWMPLVLMDAKGQPIRSVVQSSTGLKNFAVIDLLEKIAAYNAIKMDDKFAGILAKAAALAEIDLKSITDCFMTFMIAC